MSDADVLQRWEREVGVLRNQCSTLLGFRDVYRQTQHIIAANPALNIPSAFFDLVAAGYASAATVGVRRLVFPSGNAICLKRLLNDFKRHVHLLTREAIEARGERHRFVFHDHFSDEEAVSAAMIDAEVAELDRTCRPLKNYVDEHLAHVAQSPSCSIPKFSELHDGLACVERVLLKYGPLVDGRPFLFLYPMHDHDWRAVFRVAWLPSSAG